MRYVPLCRTDLEISALCLGTVGFGGRGEPPRPWTLDEDSLLPSFRRAIEADPELPDRAVERLEARYAPRATVGHV